MAFNKGKLFGKTIFFILPKVIAMLHFYGSERKHFFPLSTDILQDGNSDYAHAQQREAFFSVKTKLSQCYFDSHCPVRKIKNNILYSNKK